MPRDWVPVLGLVALPQAITRLVPVRPRASRKTLIPGHARKRPGELNGRARALQGAT